MISVAQKPSERPHSMAELKALVGEKSVHLKAAQAQIIEITAEALRYKVRLEILEEQIRLMRHQRFGSSSEKGSSDQLNLFDEAELSVLDAENEETGVDGANDAQGLDERLEASGPSDDSPKPRARRNPLPKDLPRIRQEHDLSDAQKTCSCGGAMTRIGEETSEQLEIIPAKMQVIVHVRFTYACKSCEEGIQTAPLPPQPIPKSNAAPGLLA